MLSEGGVLLGAFAGAKYEEEALPLEPGDTVVLYTDGLTESRWNGSLFGEAGLLEAVGAAARDISPEHLVEHLFFSALDYAGGELSDDLALLAVRFTPTA